MGLMVALDRFGAFALPRRSIVARMRRARPRRCCCSRERRACERSRAADERHLAAPRRRPVDLSRDDVRPPHQPRQRLHVPLGLRAEHRLRRHVGSEVRDRAPTARSSRRRSTACASAAMVAAASRRPRPTERASGSTRSTSARRQVWIGTAETASTNDVFVSTDNGMTFPSKGMLSPEIWWKSVKVAP